MKNIDNIVFICKNNDVNVSFFNTSFFNSCILIFYSTRDQDQATNAEDVLFDMFKNEETGLVSVGKFLAVCTTKFIYVSNIFAK